MSEIRRDVLQLLSEHPHGVKISDFNGAYYKCYGKSLIFCQHGFSKLAALLKSMKDFVEIIELDEQKVVKLKSEEFCQHQVSPSCHLDGPERSPEDFTPASMPSQSGMVLMKTPFISPGNKTYADVLQKPIQQQSNKRASTSGPVSKNLNPAGHKLVTKLKDSLRKLLQGHENGMSMTQVRRSCPLLYHPDLLDGFVSIKELLCSLTDVVQVEGFGVQTRVHPAVAWTKS